MIPDIALAASAREWPDRVHRFLLDHGGGRVVDRMMTADQATSAFYDILLIDDVCSFLTPRLVAILKQKRVDVIGVYMPEDGPDAKRRLLECGIADVIESDAHPEEFLAKISAALAHRLPEPPASEPAGSPAFRVGVTGPCEGVGITEISISLAHALAGDVETVLVDMDQHWPSVAQRLGLPVHPNIRTALDSALHGVDRLPDAIHLLGSLSVVGGRADGGQGAELTRPDAIMLMDALGRYAAVVVADLGPFARTEPGLIREFDTLIVVGDATPVGVTRIIRTLESVIVTRPSLSALAVVNKTGRGSFRRSEVLDEIGRTYPELPVAMVPFDARVGQAAWDGSLLRRGRYERAVGSLAEVIVRSVT